ncbi:1045_t:CDS:2, partial [Dentiscutata erythropus]
MEPSRSLAKKATPGIKKDKQRATILLCTNATGTIKIKPLVIHYYKTPRAFSRTTRDDLDMLVHYYFNKTAWMNTVVWNSFLTDLNSQMETQNKSILLLYDQAPSHCSDFSLTSSELSNITLHTLPSHTTAHLQPLDAGIIHSFKWQYKVNALIKACNLESVLEDLLVLSTPSTPSSDSTVTGDLIITSQNEEKIIQNLIDKLPYNNMLDANEYINIDNLYGSVDLTNEEIIDIIQDNSSEIVEEPVTIESAIN